MKLIVLDCEFNQPSGKLIQWGAVVYNTNKGKIIDFDRIFVKIDEALSSDITKLTAITDSALKRRGVTHEQAALMLCTLKKKHQANKCAVVWGGGCSNDVTKVFEGSGVESPFVSSTIDVKALYRAYAACKGNTAGGLGKSLSEIGLDWNSVHGYPHDALADAYNTARMYHFLSRCMAAGVTLTRGVGEC
jgi:inhibitor of KinA sporulation pathway (predicted exonuclease)